MKWAICQGVEEAKREAAEFMKVRAVWQFFEAEAEGDALHLQKPLHTFRFKRQRQGDFLRLSDYVLPAQNGKRDHLALFVFTAGEGVRERAEKAKNDGYYFRLQGPQGLRCSHSAHASADSIREDRGPPYPPGGAGAHGSRVMHRPAATVIGR
jgi:5-methyltetrahydrofolate--homocysteine methyltransferase